MVLSEDTRHELQAGGITREQVERELLEHMDAVNQTLDPHELLAFLVLVKDSWTIENGMLTPTMKIRRNVIEEHYQPKILDWAASGQRAIWED